MTASTGVMMALQRLTMPHRDCVASFYLEAREALILTPPYQRESVWTDEQRVNLVRSLLLGVPVGSVMLNDRSARGSGPYAVVDGRQRIETLHRWFDDEFVVPTDWFEAAELADGVGDTVVCSQLSPQGSRRCRLQWKLGAHETKLPVDQEPGLYLLVNFGGVAQTDADRARVEALTTSNEGARR